MSMSNPKDLVDGFAEREAAKYEKPIPSREFLIDYLEQSIGPLTHSEICAGLQIHDEAQIEAMRRRLKAMERDGQLAINRRGGYGTLDRLHLIKGRVIGHAEGYGFVSPLGENGQDIYLSSVQMRRVFDGDLVLVRIAGWDRRGRPEGTLVEVLKRNTSQLVGRYFCESGINFVRPDNPRISQDILIADGQLGAAVPGQIVVVDIVEPPTRSSLPIGHIAEVLGEHLDPGIEIEIAIRNYAIPHQWPKDVELETSVIPTEVDTVEQRIDLRSLPLITIDGEDARDFDDAVFCQSQPHGGWTLIVAIADVSHYVATGSALDREAYQRGNSVYFPNHVVPMLPEKLSNGICSLNPAEDRLCMVCEMQIDARGVITDYQFYEGVMHSHRRMTYTQVAQIISERTAENNASIRQRFSEILPQIDNLQDLSLALQRRRAERGAIEFNSQETRILFDGQRKIDQIVPIERTDAHRLIEECMLCANLCCAQLLEKSKLPAIFRVHEGPKDERLAAVREFLGELGIGLGGGDDPQPADYQRVLKAAENREDAQVIHSVLLRSMSQAVYQPQNHGHFGLAFESYTHFTSPIRRYSDLLVHRAIRSLIRSSKKIPHIRRAEHYTAVDGSTIYPYQPAQLDEIGQHISMTERRADDATREVVSWLKCEYLMDRVGEEYRGIINAVTGFGLFVMLDELLVEGLIHVTGLPKDYYYHEPAQQRMVGERSGRVYRLGQKLTVRVVRVNLQERKIDFDLVDSGAEKSSRARPPRKTKNPKRAGNSAKRSSAKGKSKGKTKGKKSNSRR
jgi:ribonuclease R